MKEESEITYTKPSENFFTIPGVSYRGEKRTYKLFEKLTPSMTQEQLTELYNQSKEAGNPYPTDAPLIMSIAYKLAKEGVKNPDNQVILNAKSFLRGSFRNNYINTLSRIIYNFSRKDKVIHNIGTKDQYFTTGNFAGEDGWIEDMKNEEILKKVFGKTNNQINKTSNWFNNTDSYLYRRNLRPSKKQGKIEKIVWLNAVSRRFYLYGYWDFDDGCSSFRVQRIE